MIHLVAYRLFSLLVVVRGGSSFFPCRRRARDNRLVPLRGLRTWLRAVRGGGGGSRVSFLEASCKQASKREKEREQSAVPSLCERKRERERECRPCSHACSKPHNTWGGASMAGGPKPLPKPWRRKKESAVDILAHVISPLYPGERSGAAPRDHRRFSLWSRGVDVP